MESGMTTCACGCGAHAPKRGGLFRRGHNRKNQPAKRYKVESAGGILQLSHRVRAAAALGKPLPPTSRVHHVDGTKSIQSPLVICQDAAYHALLHARLRVLRVGGNPNTDKICSRCRQPKPALSFSPTNQPRSYLGVGAYCRPCDAEKHQEARDNRH